MNGQTGAGKGDKRRPMDEKKFRKNFDEINWRPKRFKVNQFVKILPYSKDEANREGRITAIDRENKRAHVSNMNMPFYGSVSKWFDFKDLA